VRYSNHIEGNLTDPAAPGSPKTKDRKMNITLEQIQEIPVTGEVNVNGNRFVKEPHVFIEGQGTFFARLEDAKNRLSPNGVGVWCKAVQICHNQYFQCGHYNVWN